MPNALTGSSAEAEAHRCFLVTTANTTPLRIGLINKTGNKFRTEELDKEIKCSPCQLHFYKSTNLSGVANSPILMVVDSRNPINK